MSLSVKWSWGCNSLTWSLEYVCETPVYSGCPHILLVLTFFLQVNTFRTCEGGQRAHGLCSRAYQNSTPWDTVMKAKSSRDSPKDSCRGGWHPRSPKRVGRPGRWSRRSWTVRVPELAEKNPWEVRGFKSIAVSWRDGQQLRVHFSHQSPQWSVYNLLLWLQGL